MNETKKLLIIAGDKRQKKLYDILTEKGRKCESVFEAKDVPKAEQLTASADIIILPLPVTKDKVNVYSENKELVLPIEAILGSVKSGQLVIGGLIDRKIKQRLKGAGASYLDFYSDESLISYNAFLTAQGAVYLMLENTDEYVVSKKILITGFGRVGKAVSHFMKVMGLDVYVAARSEVQRSQAVSYGYKAINISDIGSTVFLFDFIVNTVPWQIFIKNDVKAMKKSCVYTELASSPFGAKREDFEAYGKKYEAAASLPGRLYPSASAKAIYKAIEKYI